MLFGSHRSVNYLANPVPTGSGSVTTVALSNSTDTGDLALPTGSQAGDIAVYVQSRTVTSQGTAPVGWTLVTGNAIGAIGYISIWVKALNSTDISTGSIAGATTSINRKWAMTFRPTTPATGVTTERLVIRQGSNTIFETMTMAGTFTTPAVVIAYAMNLGSSVTTAINITNGDSVTQYNLGLGHTLAIDSAVTNTARTTNAASISSSQSYSEVLFALRGTN